MNIPCLNYPLKCRHPDCRSARAGELAMMEKMVEAIAVFGQSVSCRRSAKLPPVVVVALGGAKQNFETHGNVAPVALIEDGDTIVAISGHGDFDDQGNKAAFDARIRDALAATRHRARSVTLIGEAWEAPMGDGIVARSPAQAPERVEVVFILHEDGDGLRLTFRAQICRRADGSGELETFEDVSGDRALMMVFGNYFSTRVAS